MDIKRRLKEKALELGFAGAGFTGVEPLEPYIREIDSRPPEMYGWTFTGTFDLRKAARFSEKYPWARSLLVLIRNYHKYRFPPVPHGGDWPILPGRRTGGKKGRVRAHEGLSCLSQ